MAGYGTDQGFTDWLAGRGYTLPGTAPSEAVLRQRGSDYVDAVYGPRFWGTPTGGVSQERAWPRKNAEVYGEVVPDTDIPQAIITASYLAAWQEASEPGSLSVIASATDTIRREKVGPLETEYQGASRMQEGKPYDPLAPSANTPILTEIDGLLKPFLVLGDYGVGIWSIGGKD